MGHSLDPKKSVGFQWREHDDLGKLSSLKRDPFVLMQVNLRHPNLYFIVVVRDFCSKFQLEFPRLLKLPQVLRREKRLEHG